VPIVGAVERGDIMATLELDRDLDRLVKVVRWRIDADCTIDAVEEGQLARLVEVVTRCLAEETDVSSAAIDEINAKWNEEADACYETGVEHGREDAVEFFQSLNS
jgi:hypothetical protein